MRTFLIALAGVGLAAGAAAFALWRPAPPSTAAVTAEVVGLSAPVPVDEHHAFAIRIHNAASDPVEIVGLDGTG